MKNKIHNYDFLIVGAGLIGSLAALHLLKKKYTVLVIDKNKEQIKDNRTLAVNANSKDFLKNLDLWDKLQSRPEPISKIVIDDDLQNPSLTFKDSKEDMGNVIINQELLAESRRSLKQKKLLITGVNIPIPKILPNVKILLKNRNYCFNSIILSLGKKYQDETIIKKFLFSKDHISYVGFFKHSKNHFQTAYEKFTDNGPLAILPAPDKFKKKSTFIYSSKQKISQYQIFKLITKNFKNTHGILKFDKNIKKFKILPHISKDKYNKYFLIGDMLRSIHPVAGQGWNLGIKDIQCLGNLLDSYNSQDPELMKKYYSLRIIENLTYLSFTSSLNSLYENKNTLNKIIIKSAFKLLGNIEVFKNTFIKQAMGRTNLIG
jgi:2-polyprenyl-6-methoxyphenol hydroxylase-like FAD-dependent oxidoreductase